MENNGTGAGGKNTNIYGKKFEEKTNNENNLIDDGYTINHYCKLKNKYNYYLFKNYENKTIYFTLQNGLKKFIKYKYNIDIFRCPDEAYIIEMNNGKKIIKILEKKEQRVEGSVETKLWSSPSLKREYELILGEEFKIEYSLCLSNFLTKKFKSFEIKFQILKKILDEHNIEVLYGDDNDYFIKLNEWINN
jgi:hypothetical protein